MANEGPQSRTIAEATQKLATALEAHQLEEAVEAAKRVRGLVDDDGNVSPDVVFDALVALAIFGLEREDLDAVKADLEAAKAIGEATELGSPRSAYLLRVRATYLKKTANYDDAIVAYQGALRLLEGTDDTVELGFALENLGELLFRMGRYSDAEPVLIRGTQLLAGRDSVRIDLAANLSRLYAQTGRFRPAIEIGEQVLADRIATLGATHPLVGQSLVNLSGAYRDEGRHDEGIAALDQAVEILLSADRKRDGATALNNAAAALVDEGDFAGAEGLCRQALQFLAADGRLADSFGSVLVTLGEALDGLGRDTEAEAALANAAAVLGSVGDERGALRARLRHAGVALRGGRVDGARRSIIEITESTLALLGPDHLDYAIALQSLGTVELAAGNAVAAEGWLRESLRIQLAQLGESHPVVGETHTGLGLLLATQGRLLEASGELSLAERARDQFIEDVFVVRGEGHRLAFLDQATRGMGAFLTVALAAQAVAPELITQAFELVLRRKGIVAGLGLERRISVLAANNPELTDRLKEYERVVGEIGTLALTADTQLRVEALIERRDVLERDLSVRLGALGVRPVVANVSLEAVADALSSDSVLVELVTYTPIDLADLELDGGARPTPRRYLAFMLLPDRTLRAIDLGEAKPIDDAVTEFRESVTGRPEPKGDRGWTDFLFPGRRRTREAAIALGSMILDPMQNTMSLCRQWVLAPDGDLARVPFAALPLGEDTQVIERHEVVYVGTGRDLVRATATVPRARGTAMVVADPDYGLQAEPPDQGPRLAFAIRAFNRLWGTEREGRAVAGLLGVSPLLGRDAMEGVIKVASHPWILHIATHGFFLPAEKAGGVRSPLLRSGIALAGVNSALKGRALPALAEDGVMTADDASCLDLLGTELVTLSACETALGWTQSTDGVIGLRRSIFVAGANSQLVALWKVPDAATEFLMTKFYELAIKNRLPRGEALREAQLQARRKWKDVRSWAGFILIGNHGPIR